MSATVDKSVSYVEIGRIAKGGLGVVEMVLRQEGQFERVYAMKRPHAHLIGEPEIRSMFFQEARLAGLLQHPNVVAVLDVGEDERGPFLLMDYVEGLSLHEVIRHALTAGDLLPLSVVVQIGQQVAEGLKAAHGLIAHDGTPTPLVHRDVSPQNVLIGFDGVVRVADFGIAKALGGEGQTTTHMLKGKTGYMSPEQLRFEGVDARSDLFALGVVLFEAAAGSRLYKGDSLEQVAQKILHEPPPELASYRGDADPDFERLLMDLLAKQRDSRVQDSKTLAERLSRIAHRLFGSDEWVDLDEYMNTELADRRDQLRARRVEALRSVERRTLSRGIALAPAGDRRLPLAMLVVLLAVALGVLAVWLWPPNERAVVLELGEIEAQTTTEAELESEGDDEPIVETEVAAEEAMIPRAMRASMMRRRNMSRMQPTSDSMMGSITSMWWD